MLNEHEKEMLKDALYNYYDALVNREVFLIKEMEEANKDIENYIVKISEIKEQRQEIVNLQVKLKGLLK